MTKQTDWRDAAIKALTKKYGGTWKKRGADGIRMYSAAQGARVRLHRHVQFDGSSVFYACVGDDASTYRETWQVAMRSAIRLARRTVASNTKALRALGVEP